jgi:hypothetical protein
MILTNRLFTRTLPTREAKSIYIFCEGVKREVKYFEYFKEIDSRINIEVYPLKPTEDNSPLGLLSIAHTCLIKTEQNPNPKYELLKNDEVWIVLDSDEDKLQTRKPQIEEVRKNCKLKNWNVGQSNPCFEVWLHNHFFKTNPNIKELDKCITWKRHVNGQIGGGFDSRRHPIFIKDAIENSSTGYSEADEVPNIGSTQVFKLAEAIYSLVKVQIDSMRAKI